MLRSRFEDASEDYITHVLSGYYRTGFMSYGILYFEFHYYLTEEVINIGKKFLCDMFAHKKGYFNMALVPCSRENDHCISSRDTYSYSS